jgi:methyltransferase (TIGR00027 family)
MMFEVGYTVLSMEDGQPSFTALTAAAARAAHLIVDQEPWIFADTLAAALLGERAEELVSFHKLHGTHPVLAGARVQVTCRSRYTEDALSRAVRRGVGQYVILGAGLDSFAYRGGLVGRVRVFEVDHPATQDWKRRALAAAQVPVPEEVAFVAADLAADLLAGPLLAAGFDTAAPALVSWLGVTMYLTPDAVAGILTAVGRLATGTELIADYMLPAGQRDEEGAVYGELVARASAERGEPWLSCFAPGEMTGMARRAGFREVRNVRQRDAIPAGLWQRPDSLRPANLAVLCHAAV